MSWADWVRMMDRDAPEQRVSYAPLTAAEVPAITQVAQASLRNVIVGSHDIRCTCPIHGGDPTATTLRINTAVGASVGIGVWKCYSCGRGGHWNKLALHLGVDPLVVDTDPEYVDLPVFQEASEYQQPARLLDWPAEAVWERTNKIDGTITTIPSKVFRLFGAKLWYTRGRVEKAFADKGKQYYVGDYIDEVRAWLPIENWPGQAEAHVAALLSWQYPKAKKYLNSPGPWPRRYLAFHVAAQQLRTLVGADTLVLVEGPADAMRLMGLGIPAVSLLGVGSWTDTKAGLVASCWPRALVCLDADAAGRGGQARVLASLEANMTAIGIELPEGHDPASMEQVQLLSILGAHGVRPRNYQY